MTGVAARDAWIRRGLFVAGAILGAIMLVRGVQSSGTLELTAALEVLSGWAFVGSGTYLWRRRPAERLGPLMVAVGILWLLGRTFGLVDHSVMFTTGIWLADLWLASFALFLLSFPDGHLRSTTDRAIVGTFLFVSIPLEFAWLLFWEPSRGATNALALFPDPVLADRVDTLQRAIIAVTAVVMVVVLVRRWYRATQPMRRLLAPVLVGAVATLLGVSLTVASKLGINADPLVWIVLAADIAVPIASMLVVLQTWMARGGVADLVVELGDSPAPERLRDALANALGDHDLSVVYWSEPQQAFVDSDGASVAPPVEGSGKAVTLLERSGTPLAAIVHDAALLDDPGLVASVASAMRLAVENERLQSEVQSQLNEVRASRTRILEAGEAERKRVERNLHDGAQQRIVSLTLALRLARARLGDDGDPAVRASLEAAAAEARAALAELRELARGIHPQILSRAGLGPAFESLADHSPVDVSVEMGSTDRFPPIIEGAAYFVVSEALANVAKYAHATHAIVRTDWHDDGLFVEITDDGIGGADPEMGTGLRGLIDRLDAIDGTLDIVSPAGGGTRVLARIPAMWPLGVQG